MSGLTLSRTNLGRSEINNMNNNSLKKPSSGQKWVICYCNKTYFDDDDDDDDGSTFYRKICHYINDNYCHIFLSCNTL